MKQYLIVLINNPLGPICHSYFGSFSTKLLNLSKDLSIFSFAFEAMYNSKCEYNDNSKDGFFAIGVGFCKIIE